LSASADEQNSGSSFRSEDLLPIMYHELKSLARARLRGDAGHTLQPTALVHEAYLRLTRGASGGAMDAAVWNGPGHFFGAAAEAMRQVLVDHARGKHAIKRGGERRREALHEDAVAVASETDANAEHVLLVNDAVDALAREDPMLADILKLRYFAGLSREETAAALDLSPRTLDRRWRYIVAVLRAREASQD
jgi:RNA polymerase sigma factor (TIGR02999 family)